MKYAIISDIHEDIVGLKKVIQLIERHQADKLVCLGDIIGYSKANHSHEATKDANACIDLLKNKFDIVLPGNHDLNAIGKNSFYIERHKKANSFIPKETWEYKAEINPFLSDSSIDFLNQLPEYYIDSIENFQILFSHFVYPDLCGETMFIPETRKDVKPHFNFMNRKECLISFVGHTHINGFAMSNGRFVRFREFGFTKLPQKQQVIFCPAIVKDGERSGFVLFDTDTFELSIIKIDN